MEPIEKPSNNCAKASICDDIVWDFAHDEDFEPVLAPLQSVPRHCRDHLLRLRDAAAERHHDLQIGQPHLVAHPGECGAFERKAVGIGRVGVTRGAAEAEHRIVLLRLEPGAADQAGIFVGLEVGQPHDDRLRIERRGDGADALRQLLDKIIGRPGIIAHQPC